MDYKEVLKFSFIKKRLEEYKYLLPEEYYRPDWLLLFDMAYSFLRYRCTVKDYIMYEFYKLNRFGRNQFFTGGRADKWYSKNNDPVLMNELKNKEKTLVKFSDYINRDWCGPSYHQAKDFLNFQKKHEKAILKPLDDCGGHGVRIINLRNPEFSEGGLQKYCIKNHCLIEELITQHETMGKLHNSSINTLRIMTYHKKVIGAVLRIGVGNSNIDNASSGGIYAQIDVEEGVVISCALNYAGEKVIRHPETGIIILGFEIPMWSECLKFVNKCLNIIEGVPLVGWDIAISPDGPVLVEVNERPDPFLIQSVSKEGIQSNLNGE